MGESVNQNRCVFIWGGSVAVDHRTKDHRQGSQSGGMGKNCIMLVCACIREKYCNTYIH